MTSEKGPFISECRERIWLDGIASAQKESTGIAQEARHVSQDLNKGPHLVPRGEIGIVLRRVAKGLLRTIRDRGKVVCEKRTLLIHYSVPSGMNGWLHLMLR